MIKASQLNHAKNICEQLSSINEQIRMIPDVGRTFSMPTDHNKPMHNTVYNMWATMTSGIHIELLNQLHTERMRIENELTQMGVDPNA